MVSMPYIQSKTNLSQNKSFNKAAKAIQQSRNAKASNGSFAINDFKTVQDVDDQTLQVDKHNNDF